MKKYLLSLRTLYVPGEQFHPIFLLSTVSVRYLLCLKFKIKLYQALLT
jgi:hypothetical protein